MPHDIYLPPEDNFHGLLGNKVLLFPWLIVGFETVFLPP